MFNNEIATNIKLFYLQYFRAFLVIGVFNVLILQAFNQFDFRSNAGWRNTDITAQTKHFHNGASFWNPTVDVSRNKFGAAFLETSFPVMPYLAAQVSSFLEKRKIGFETVGNIKIQTQLPYTFLGNIEATKTVEDNTNIQRISFEKYTYIPAKIFDYGANLSKFYVSIPPSQCGRFFELTLNGKSIVPQCHKTTNGDQSEVTNRQLTSRFQLNDGIHNIVFKAEIGDEPSIEPTLYSMFETSSIYERAVRITVAAFNTLASFAVYLLLCQFFAHNKVFNIALSVSFAGLYHYYGMFHEEPLAMALCLFAVLIWIRNDLQSKFICKYDLIAFALIGLAMSLRLYYGAFLIFFATYRFQTLIEEIKGSSILVAAKNNVIYSFYSLILVLALPSIWFFHTQSRVRVGGDSIDIFTSRVFFNSLADAEKWKALFGWILTTHFTAPAILAILIMICFVAFLRNHTKKAAKFCVASGAITLALFPLLFDSAAVHDYYIFPCTFLLLLSIFVLFLDSISQLGQNARYFKQAVWLIPLLMLFSTMQILNHHVTWAYRWGGDNYDFYVGARYHDVTAQMASIQPFFPLDQGPQSYFLAKSVGHRPLDIVGGVYKNFKDSVQKSPTGQQEYGAAYFCEITAAPMTVKFAKRYFSELNWAEYHIDNTLAEPHRCFLYLSEDKN